MDKTKIVMVLLILAIVFSVVSIIISFNATNILSSNNNSPTWGKSNSGAVGNVVFFVEGNNAEGGG